MKIIATIIIAISLVNMATADRSTRYRSDSTDPTEFRLLDALEYTCTDILPSMDHLNVLGGYFGELTMGLQPVCDYVLKAADAPSGFDATKFCDFLVDYLQLRELMRHVAAAAGGVFGPESPLAFIDTINRVTGNVIKNLYGMDIENPTTICPQAHRLFEPSLFDFVDDFGVEYNTELISDLIPALESICQDWKGYFVRLGVPGSSPHQRLIGSLLDVGSSALGFDGLEDMCQKIRSEKIFSMDGPERRMFSKTLFNTFLDLDDEPGGTSQPFGGPKNMKSEL